ncbi:cytosolic protein [Bacillus timonensis]|uniref:Cytosolic protein n=1 Tax=Bacillus timonensis TaxID=1033734 RepID=A0A4S3PU05_9BACI|nr:cytosolic protein [Bacillus timonensis]THE12855.1 cytosolic protein [Bacillus timonensis]
MYSGRDMTHLSMIPKNEWKESELAFFHHSFQQIVPYLNAEGQSLHREIIQEIEARGGFHRNNDYTSDIRMSYDTE